MTAVLARHVSDAASAKQVEVVYGRDQKAYSVRGKAAVLACWNMFIPFLRPDLPAQQKEVLHYGVKVPLVYTVVGLRNWTAFQKLGVRGISYPGMYHSSMNLDQPANIGDYKPQPESADQPILLHMLRTPCQPGLSAREQQRAGHYDLLAMSFETFERNISDQLVRVLGGAGFDRARDIEAITVNSWPTDMRMNTTRCGIRIGPRVSDRVTLPAGPSDASPSRIPMLQRPRTPIRPSIKVTGLYESCSRAKSVTMQRGIKN